MSPFTFELNATNLPQIAVLLMIAFAMVAVISSLVVHAYYLKARRNAKKLEKQLQQKNKELQVVIEELKETQLRLIESGKMSAAAALSAGILHQISQPITAIHGFVRFIKQEITREHVFYKPVCLIDEQSVYLKDMLENLMTIIRHRKIQKVHTNINEVLRRSISLVSDELRIRRIHWESMFDASVPLVYVDPVHLQQVFMNILVNACEALGSQAHGKERRLKISTKFDNMEKLVGIVFCDNGPGIPDGISAHIFEPFFSTKTTGTGIGLALCHDLIAEHGGNILVRSHPGETQFTIVLPLSKNPVLQELSAAV